MTISLDGYDILARIGLNKEAFPGLKREAAILAETLLRRELMRTDLRLAGLKAIRKAIGEEALGLVLETMDGRALGRLQTAVDGERSRAEGEEAPAIRRRLLDMAAGRRPSGAQPKPKAKRALPKQSRRLQAAGAASPFGTRSMAAGKKR